MNASEVMLEAPVTLSPGDSVAYAIRKAGVADLDILPVVDEKGRYIGAVPKAELVGKAHDPDAKVCDLCCQDAIICHPEQPVEHLDHDAMSAVPHRTIVVVDDHGQFRGVVPWVNWAVDEARTQSGHPRSPMEVRTYSMHLVRRCLDCGALTTRNDNSPLQCPYCGAGAESFALHTED